MSTTQFFKADAIDHYRIEIEGESLSALEFGESLSKSDQIKKQVLFDEQHLMNIKESKFIENLENINFAKTEIEQIKLAQIQSVFTLKEVTKIEPSYCGAVFRDVLVFYRKGDTWGNA